MKEGIKVTVLRKEISLKKILVFGSGGLVGFKISNLIIDNDYEFFGTYNLRNPVFGDEKTMKLDVREYDKVKKLIENTKPDIIVNSCSLTGVDYCEKHEDEAFKLNVGFVSQLFSVCKNYNIKLVHLSSDSVFDGTKTIPYVEEDQPNPINVYGKTKYESEKIILQNPNHLVVRATVLYGWLPKFLAKCETSSMKPMNFGQWLIQQLQNEKEIRIITDEISSPIIADDFAKAVLHLSVNNFGGLYHLAPDIIINRYEFSCKIAEKLSLNKNLIIPITNKELGRDANSGFNRCLNSQKARKQTGFSFMNLDESLNILKRQIST